MKLSQLLDTASRVIVEAYEIDDISTNPETYPGLMRLRCGEDNEWYFQSDAECSLSQYGDVTLPLAIPPFFDGDPEDITLSFKIERPLQAEDLGEPEQDCIVCGNADMLVSPVERAYLTSTGAVEKAIDFDDPTWCPIEPYSLKDVDVLLANWRAGAPETTAAVLAGLRKSQTQKTDNSTPDHIESVGEAIDYADERRKAVNDAVTAALDAGCAAIQARLGVTTGDYASIYFSGDEASAPIVKVFESYFDGETSDKARSTHRESGG